MLIKDQLQVIRSTAVRDMRLPGLGQQAAGGDQNLWRAENLMRDVISCGANVAPMLFLSLASSADAASPDLPQLRLEGTARSCLAMSFVHVMQ